VIVWLAAATVAFVLLAGLLIALFGLGIDGGDDAGFVESFWQALMRIFDPGTMADDVGWGLRAVTLSVTLAGIFVATSLIGLVATSLDQKIADLRKGRSAVLEHNHTLILGWSRRLFSVLSELVEANRNQQGMAVVILASEDKSVMEDAVRARVPDTGTTRIVCRTGDPASPADLDLVNVNGARAVIVLSGEHEGDAAAVKSVLAVMSHDPELRERPVVVEMIDGRTARSLSSATSARALTVQADDVIAKVTAQACYQAGLSLVYRELLDFSGDEIYLAPADPLVGRTFGESLLAYPTSTIMGRRLPDGTIELAPPMDAVFGAGDEIVAISADDDTVVFGGFTDAASPPVASDGAAAPASIRMLVVGWSSLGPRILQELDPFVEAGSTVDVLVDGSIAPASTLADPCCPRLVVNFHSTDDETEALAALLESTTYGLIVVLGYRDTMTASQADARSLLALLTIRRVLGVKRSGTRVVCEVLDSRDVTLAQATGVDDFVVSDELSSLMIAQLAERPELLAVFDELFDKEGASISVRPASAYLDGDPGTFAGVIAAARARSHVAIGYRLRSGEVVINPPKASPLALSGDDAVIVLARTDTP
jgi:voltage-gated potassium channel Kch